MSSKVSKIQKVDKGVMMLEKTNSGILTTFNKRDISVDLVAKDGGTSILFRIEDDDADMPSISHRTQFNGKVRASQLFLSLEGVIALHKTLELYLKHTDPNLL